MIYAYYNICSASDSRIMWCTCCTATDRNQKRHKLQRYSYPTVNRTQLRSNSIWCCEGEKDRNDRSKCIQHLYAARALQKSSLKSCNMMPHWYLCKAAPHHHQQCNSVYKYKLNFNHIASTLQWSLHAEWLCWVWIDGTKSPQMASNPVLKVWSLRLLLW